MQTDQAMQALLEEYALTIPEAAAVLGETEKAIHRLIYTAKLDAVRVKTRGGHEFRLRRSDVLAHRARCEGAEAPVAVEPSSSSEGEWADVYRELVLRYDQLGRRAVRLERENRRLRDVLAQFHVPAPAREEQAPYPLRLAASSAQRERAAMAD
jgi:hypothetical protein